MDDPMVWESLPYPKTLDRNILAARAQELVVPKTDVDTVTKTDVRREPTSLDPENEEPDRVQHEELCDESGKATKRKERGKNWIDQKETDELLKAVLKKKNAGSARLENSRTGCDLGFWQAIAKEVPGRTDDECRGRMDTLKKSYRAIKKYCDEHQIQEFSEKIFHDMKPKLSPKLTQDWYNQIRDYCPPRPKKKLRAMGLQPPIPTDASSFNESCPDATSSNAVMSPPDGIDPSKSTTLAVFEPVVESCALSLMQLSKHGDYLQGNSSTVQRFTKHRSQVRYDHGLCMEGQWQTDT